MKNFISLLLILGVLFPSCDKKGGDPPFFLEKINGVYVKSDIGLNVDSLGVPNSYTTDGSFSLKVLGNPVDDTLRYEISEPNAEGLYYTMRLEASGFDKIPNSLPVSIGEGPIPVENIHLSGRNIKSGGTTGTFKSLTTNTFVGDLPRGFYKLYIEMKDGRKFWENIWIYRPD